MVVTCVEDVAVVEGEVGVEEEEEDPFSVTVYVVFTAGTMISCERAPPSDHEPNASELSVGSTTPMVLVMPTTAEKVYGAAYDCPSRVID